MRSIRLAAVLGMITLIACWAGISRPLSGQSMNASEAAAGKKTGYAIKKPVFGGACKTCPWGAMAEIVKAAMQPYGYDIQICYSCAGGAEEARIVAGAKMPPPWTPVNGLASSLVPQPPDGPVDFGSTGAEYLWWAYQGAHDFAHDPEGPRKSLRIVANIQEPSYFTVAVRADSGITDLHQIVEKRLPVPIMASTTGGTQLTPMVLNYYGLTKEAMESFGGQLRTNMLADKKNLDVIIGWGALENAPEYNMWYDVSQRYDLKYLALPDDLRAKMEKEFDLREGVMPIGLFRGVDQPIPAMIRTGNVVYGRTDMPDDFAYTLAKAVVEHLDLFQFANGAMYLSYNSHTVWKAFDIPLHPGAARYYKGKGIHEVERKQEHVPLTKPTFFHQNPRAVMATQLMGCPPMRFRNPIYKTLCLAALIIGAILSLGSCRTTDHSVGVGVAANFTQPAKLIAQLFEQVSGDKVALSFGSTGQLYAQVTQGAPFEVFLAADQEAAPAKAVSAGLAEQSGVFTYAIGRLVLYSNQT